MDTTSRYFWSDIPDYTSSKQYVTIYEHNNTDKIIHTQQIADTLTHELYYKYLKGDSIKAYDVGVLKLINPSRSIIKYSLPYKILDTSYFFSKDQFGILKGFDGANGNLKTILGRLMYHMAGEKLSEDRFYFINSVKPAMSGSPIVIIRDGIIKIGVIIADFHSQGPVGQGVFAKIVKEIIDRQKSKLNVDMAFITHSPINPLKLPSLSFFGTFDC